MEIKQTKCDQCGAIRDIPMLCVIFQMESTKKAGVFYPQPYDFCNEDCLREFLVKRDSDAFRKVAAATISVEAPKAA